MNLVCFGHLPWSPMQKRNQSMVTCLQKEGIFRDIIFINPYVRLTDIVFKFNLQFRNVAKFWSWKRLLPGRVRDGVVALTTVFFGPQRAFACFNRLISLPYMSFIKNNYCKEEFILLINDFDPDREIFYKELIPAASKVVVDLSDDFLSFSEKEAKLAEIKSLIEYCISKADEVLCVNEAVLSKYDDHSGKFRVFKNGVSVEPFVNANYEPDFFAQYGIKRPVIGYMGWISKGRLDAGIVDAMARRFRDYSFVFLGQDVKGYCRELTKKYPNFRHLPAVAYGKMAKIVVNFDLAVIPHSINEHTSGNSLLKAYAFMAAKVPVVSTAASGLDEFKDIIDVASGSRDFCDLMEKNLKDKDALRLEKGFNLALGNSWEEKIKQIMPVFAGKSQRDKVSVCVTAYNEEKNISRCLDFIVRQQGVDIDEILVGVNSSTDSTKNIVESYAQKDNRVRVVDSPKGKANAWNVLNKQARNNLRFFQDGDCVAASDAYRKLLRELDDNDVIGASINRVTSGRSIIARIISFPRKYVRPYPLLNGNLYLMDYRKVSSSIEKRLNLTAMPGDNINDDVFLQMACPKVSVSEDIFVDIEVAGNIEEEINRFKRMCFGNLWLKQNFPQAYQEYSDKINAYRKRFSKFYQLTYLFRAMSIFEMLLFIFVMPVKFVLFRYIHSRAKSTTSALEFNWS